MNPVVQTSYQLSFIAISFGISVLGAFVALNAATRIRNLNGQLSWLNTACAGIALGGIGVWSMHFIGMLALKMDMATSYGMTETLISLVAAIVATSLALAFVSKAPDRLGRIAGAGFLLGGLSVLVGGFLTGGIGPWTPFQMFAAAWVTLGAALLPKASGWRERLLLAGYGFVASLAFGAVMNLWFWPFMTGGAPDGGLFVAGDPASLNAARYAVFYVATSLGWDLPRAVLTAGL